MHTFLAPRTKENPAWTNLNPYEYNRIVEIYILIILTF